MGQVVPYLAFPLPMLSSRGVAVQHKCRARRAANWLRMHTPRHLSQPASIQFCEPRSMVSAFHGRLRSEHRKGAARECLSR